MRTGRSRARVERNLSMVAGDSGATDTDPAPTSPPPRIMGTFDRGGDIWTGLLTPASDPHLGSELTFVRDWIIGGTRRAGGLVSSELADAVKGSSGEQRIEILRRELDRVLSRGGERAITAPRGEAT